MRSFLQDIIASRDTPSLLFFVAIVLTSAWCLALPVSESVQNAYLKRFHLRSDSFVGWAGQQLTPAMYNLENKYLFSPQALNESERKHIENDFYRQLKNRSVSSHEDEASQNSTDTGQVRLDMLNHFPTRTMTFVTSRNFLKQQREGYFYFRSRYRGSSLDSIYHIEPVTESQSRVSLIAEVREAP